MPLGRREKRGLEIPQVETDLGTRPPTFWTHQLINCQSTTHKIGTKSIFLRGNCRKGYRIYFLINIRVIQMSKVYPGFLPTSVTVPALHITDFKF